MIQVRDIFQVKFGKIDQAVALFARLPKLSHTHAEAAVHYHVLTDISGPMYTLVTELMAPNLSGWETLRDQSFQEPAFAAWFKEFQLYVDGGRREYFTLEGECTDWSRPGVTVVRQVYRALKWQIRPAVGLLQQYGALVTAFDVGRSPRILTDASGPMFQVIVEFETDNLAHWEQQRRGLFAQPDFQAWFAKLLSQVEAGAHEFYRVEA